MPLFAAAPTRTIVKIRHLTTPLRLIMTIAAPTLKPPSVALANLPRECEGGFGIHIARDGQWWHQGRPIGRPALVRLFASVLNRDAAGTFWLQTPVERGRITVEDAPFVGVELRASSPGAAEQALDVRTNLDEWVEIGPHHGLRVTTDATGAPQPYILVRDRLEAKLTRAVFYDLVGHAEGEEFVAVLSRGVWFPLGPGAP
jgi:uncharacterized protein